jgi:predicted membrane protein DUF2142
VVHEPESVLAYAGPTAGSGCAKTVEPRRQLRRLTLFAFLGFFLTGAAWALAMPWNGSADESEHIVRAYGVASGQILSAPQVLPDGHPGATFQVPRSLVPRNPYCMYFNYQRDERTDKLTINSRRQPASCLEVPPDNTALEPVQSWVGRYNPAYYELVGLPMLIAPNMGGVIAARLVSAAMSAACLAVAMRLAWAYRRRFVLVGVLLAATPTTVSLTGAINPSGLEISSAIALWVALMALVGGYGSATVPVAPKRLLWLCVALACVLVNLRGLGVLWLVLGCAAVVLAVGPRMARAHARLLPHRWPAVGVVAAAVVAATVWNVISGNFQWYTWLGASHMGYDQAIRYELAVRVDTWLHQMVGQFGWTDSLIPWWAVFGWIVVTVLAFGPALLEGGRRDRATVLAILVASFVLLIGFEMRYLRTLGFAQFGRYVLPLTVALFPIAAASRQPLRGAAQARVIRLVGVVFVVAQVWGLAEMMTRFQLGITAQMNPFRGYWLPAVGPVVPLLAMAAGVAVLTWLPRWRAPVEPPPAREFPPARAVVPAGATGAATAAGATAIGATAAGAMAANRRREQRRSHVPHEAVQVQDSTPAG